MKQGVDAKQVEEAADSLDGLNWLGRAVRWFVKSGEGKQPYGDQNELNAQEPGGERKKKKLRRYDYDKKMGETDVDEYENARSEYHDSERRVHKTLEEIEEDDDLDDEERVPVVNRWLNDVMSSLPSRSAGRLLGPSGRRPFADSSRREVSRGTTRRHGVPPTFTNPPGMRPSPPPGTPNHGLFCVFYHHRRSTTNASQNDTRGGERR